MQSFACVCGAEHFFENTACASCGAAVGWCDACNTLTSLTTEGRCGNQGCGASLKECGNRERHAVCTGYVASESAPSALCRRCVTTTLAPDPNVPANLTRWRKLERAKRRLLYDLAAIGLGEGFWQGAPPLTFRFPNDTPDESFLTGHADGVITIRLDEADSVRREELRVNLGEPQRTLIGHLRHEVSHYLWLRLVDQADPAVLQEVVGLFGDPQQDYAAALEKHYAEGAPANWAQRYISPYAASHPWEDFAETAGFYLDLRSVLAVVDARGVARAEAPEFPPDSGDAFADMLRRYLAAGVYFNEVNRSMGLTDLVPEVILDPVVAKLSLVHRLMTAA